MRPQSIFFVDKNDEFARKALESIGVEANEFRVSRHTNKEFKVRLEQAVRDKNVYIIKSTAIKPNESLVELAQMVRAASNSKANRVTVVAPAMCYVRDDSKAKRSPFAAAWSIEMLTMSGMDRMILVDIHSEQYRGFGAVPKDDIKPRSVFVKDIKERVGDDIVLVPLTYGGMFRVQGYKKFIKDKKLMKNVEIAMVNPDEETVSIDVSGKKVFIINDIIDNAKKLTKAAKVFMNAGAAEVHGIATHSLLSARSVKLIESSEVKTLTVSDTLPLHASAVKSEKIRVVSLMKFFARILRRIDSGDSVGKTKI